MKMSDKQKAIRAALKGNGTALDQLKQKPEYMIYKSLNGYLQIDRIPLALHDLDVIHTFEGMTQENYLSRVCKVPEFLEKVKSGEIKGWAMIAIEPQESKYDAIQMDYLNIDARGRGQYFLANQTIGQYRAMFKDCQESKLSTVTKLPPHLALYLVPDLSEYIKPSNVRGTN